MGVATAAVIGSAVVGAVASDRASKKGAKAAKRSASTSAEAQIQAAEIAAEAQEAARLDAAERLKEQTAIGQGFLGEFAPVQQAGLDNLSFITDPNEQFQFLQNNPLFQASLEEAQRQTQRQAGATGRFGAGDTLQALSQNFLTTAQPLIRQRVGDIQGLLASGQNLAGSRANLAIGLGSQLSESAQQAGNIAAASAAARGQALANQAQQIGQAQADAAAARGQAIQGITQAIGTGIAGGFGSSSPPPSTQVGGINPFASSGNVSNIV